MRLDTLFGKDEQDDYQLVILDGDIAAGAEHTARTIKAAPKFSGLPIVLMTSVGLFRPNDGTETGLFASRLTKPIRRAQLYNADRRAVISPELGPGNPPDKSREEIKPLVGLRVLLAEDNPTNRKVAVGIVERLGCQIDVAFNGREAVDMSSPDVTISYSWMSRCRSWMASPRLPPFASVRGRRIGTYRSSP